MAGRIIIPGLSPCLDANGVIDPGATVQFYANRTTTPQDIFTDPSLSVELDNPLDGSPWPDSSGRLPEIWGPDGAVYTVEWTPTGESPITYNDIALSGDPVPATQYLPCSRSVEPVLTNSQRIISWNVPFPLSLAATLNDGVYPSIFTISTFPTAPLVLTLKKNATTIGTITFSTGGVPTVAFVSQVDFVPTDKFYVFGPASADATGAGVDLTFVFNLRQG